MAVYRLSNRFIWFPNPEEAEEDGLLAVGGDLSTKRLLEAYKNGIFPWYNPGEEILWWCPKERFVIFPEEIKISKSMKKFMKKNLLTVSFNQSFDKVIHECRMLRELNEGTWITDEMEVAYNKMFQNGYAMSVECMQQNKLVGGLYGVNIGHCFFGESMFSKVKNASKLALIALANKLKDSNYQFIDCQFYTDHLKSMGGRYISYKQYMTYLKNGIQHD